MRSLRHRVSLQICNFSKFKSTNHAFATVLTRNFSKEDERLEMVLRATTVSKKNFKEASLAKKNALEFVILSNEQLGRKTSD